MNRSTFALFVALLIHLLLFLLLWIFYYPHAKARGAKTPRGEDEGLP